MANISMSGGQDSFSPMGLFQEQLKGLLYSKMPVSNSNWTNEIKMALRVRGQSQFYTRFIWKGLPNGLDGQQVERMLYYRGMLGMFYHKDYGFVLLPVIQQSDKNDNSISFMGRWKYARPVPFNGGGEDKNKQKDKMSKIVLEADIGKKNILWEVPFVEDEEQAKKLISDSCVLLYDYTPQISEIPLSRSQLENPFYEGQIELIKMIRTASLNSTGVTWIKVNNQAEADTMQDQFKVYDQLILNGVRYLCISASTDLQEGSTKSTAQMQEFWTSWQSLENLRQSCMGLGNDGMVQKSQYQNIQEQALDNIGNNPVLIDAWLQRVKFCTIVNALYGLNIGVEVAGMTPMETNQQSQTESSDEGSEGGESE